MTSNGVFAPGETTADRRLLVPDYSEYAFDNAVNAALEKLDRP